MTVAPRRRRWIAALLVALVLGGLAALFMVRTGADATGVRLRPDDSRLIATGARVYQAHCASCHGLRLEGQPNWRQRGPDDLLPAPPHDASGHTWHHPDETLFRITKLGVAAVIGDPSYKSAMPAYAGVLTDEEIVAVLSWVKAQWPATVRDKHDQINAQKR